MNMNQKGFANVAIIVFIIVIAGVIGYFSINNGSIDIKQSWYSNEIPHEDLNKDLRCIYTGADFEKEFVVNSDTQYQNLLQYRSSASCEKFVLPSIDFSKKTLLGKFTSSSGCKIDFARKVYKSDSDKKIIYVIENISTGICEMFGSSMNWVLISKIPSDYSVEFQVKK